MTRFFWRIRNFLLYATWTDCHHIQWELVCDDEGRDESPALRCLVCGVCQ